MFLTLGWPQVPLCLVQCLWYMGHIQDSVYSIYPSLHKCWGQTCLWLPITFSNGDIVECDWHTACCDTRGTTVAAIRRTPLNNWRWPQQDQVTPGLDWLTVTWNLWLSVMPWPEVRQVIELISILLWTQLRNLRSRCDTLQRRRL